MTRGTIRVVVSGCLLLTAVGPSRADGLDPDRATRDRCAAVLRRAFASDEFWPTMHAVEALSPDGHGQEVRSALAPRVKDETDDQRRCGLARELVRAGDLSYVSVLKDVLAKPDPYGHAHACESLFKVGQIGEASLLRKALAHPDSPKLSIMAAAALSRGGHRGALARLR